MSRANGYRDQAATAAAVAFILIMLFVSLSCGRSDTRIAADGAGPGTPASDAASPKPGPGTALEPAGILAGVAAYKSPPGVDKDVFLQLRHRLAELLTQKYAGDSKAVSKAPPGDNGKVTDLAYNIGNRTITWRYVNRGDYDFSGDVGVSDITPVALNFLALTTDGVGNDALQAWIDGDKSGEVGISDVTVIALSYLNQITGYKLLVSPDEAGPYTDLDFVPMGSLGTPLGLDAVFTGVIPQAVSGYVTVAPQDANGDMGDMSNAVLVGTKPDILSVAPLIGQESTQITLIPEVQGTQPLSYSWDLAAAGLPATSTDQSPLVTLVAAPGTYQCSLTTTNDYGSDQFTFSIEVTQAPIIPPVASLTATPETGLKPLDVTLDASGSFDSDGTIVRYDWDWNSDGVFDMQHAVAPGIVHTFILAGDYTTTVRVTDDDGAIDEAQVLIHVNEAPTAVLIPSPSAGYTPLDVNLNASGSNDKNGTIALCEWDYEGDGTYDYSSASSLSVVHTYDVSGSYTPTIRVTDNDGATAIDSATVDVNDKPTAAISANPLAGDVALSVDFDASASTDADGSIVLYEWDWDSDGAYDEGSGATPTINHIYASVGTYVATVRVTDNSGGQDTASVPIIVRGWVPEFADYGGPIQTGQNISLKFDANGQACVAYQARTLNDTLFLKYATRTTASWTKETVDAPNGESCGAFASLDFDGNGYPVIAYNYAGSLAVAVNDLKIAWKGPGGWTLNILDGDGTGDYNWGMDINLHFYSANKACILHHSWRPYYATLLTWDGSSWTKADMPAGGYATGFVFDGAGNPVTFQYTYIVASETELNQFEAFWKNGAAWDRTLVDSGHDVGKAVISAARDGDGNPAASYYDAANLDVKFAKWNGSGWDNEIVASAGSVGQYNSLAFSPDGTPYIAYYDGTTFSLKIAVYNGSTWDISTIDSGTAQKHIGEFCSLAFSPAGYPAVAYSQNKMGDYGLRYAWYYTGS